MLLFPLQCDDETRYKVLSFFFDGVPLPTSMQEVQPPNTSTVATDTIKAPPSSLALKTSRSPEPTLYLHQPFKEKKCDLCHQSTFGQSLIAIRVDLVCRTCHEQFNQNYSFIHGPVAVGQCLKCHNPHKSSYPKLLTRSGDQVCTYCHELINRESIVEHLDEGELGCVRCHSPHFSPSNPLFLVNSSTKQ